MFLHVLLRYLLYLLYLFRVLHPSEQIPGHGAQKKKNSEILKILEF